MRTKVEINAPTLRVLNTRRPRISSHFFAQQCQKALADFRHKSTARRQVQDTPKRSTAPKAHLSTRQRKKSNFLKFLCNPKVQGTAWVNTGMLKTAFSR